jgi:serine/threonine protein kinase/tetratricopeptide (TPR) repeat protein
MNTEIIERAMQIFEEVYDLDEDARLQFIQNACSGNDALRSEVDLLIQNEHGVEILNIEAIDEVDSIPFEPCSADRYELLDEIGQGGMGIVYRAHDHQLDRDVALKILREVTSKTANARRRFAAEAQFGARLQHPGIASVYDLGQLPDGRIFFAMKLVRGKTMASQLPARSDTLDDRSRLLSVFEQLCKTVAYAHSHGIIHRDLKPNNVMIGEFGEVQVMDWGLAKSLLEIGVEETNTSDEHDSTRPSPHDWSPSSGSETRVGIVMGTPAYMPPEQSAGKRGKPTDVFSLGAILCEILTGAPPYTAQSPAEIYDKSAHADLQDANNRLENCDSDPELIKLAKQCLEPQPEDRPADANELAQRFSGFLQTIQSRLRTAELSAARSAVIAQEEKKRRRVTRSFLVTALTLVTVIFGGWAWVSHESVQRSQNRAERQAETIQQINDAKTEAIRLRQLVLESKADDLATWAQAHTAIAKAEAILQASDTAVSDELAAEIASLSQDIAREELDRKLLVEIEAARESAVRNVTIPEQQDVAFRERRAHHLEEVFAKEGLHPNSTQPQVITQFISKRSDRVRNQLVGAFDEWLVASHKEATRKWILEGVAESDTNQWRIDWRQAVVDNDHDSIQQLSEDPQIIDQEPRSVINLYDSLVSLGSFQPTLLQRIYINNADHFWLNVSLGDATFAGNDANVPMRSYTLALGKREFSGLYHRLGHLLINSGKYNEAIFHLKRAVELDPHSSINWETLATAYTMVERIEDAQKAWTRASELQPGDPAMTPSYARFLHLTNRASESIELLRRNQTPIGQRSEIYRNNLVNILATEKRFLEASKFFDQKVEEWYPHLSTETRAYAGISAVQAADKQGVGTDDMTDEDCIEMRRLGLHRLQNCLKSWLARTEKSESVLRVIIAARQSGEFASVRLPARMRDLTHDEQREWRQFWYNVDEAERQLTYRDPLLNDLSNWIVLEPKTIKSSEGAAFERQPDGSFLATGPNVQGDVYSIKTDLSPEGIIAIRLDVIEDERLPGNGPGRHPTGNFHLAEIILEVPNQNAPGGRKTVRIPRAWASYAWKGLEIKNTIDGNIQTVWHVWGELGLSHTAIFHLAEPLTSADANSFTIRLTHGAQLPASLGRFRLSIQRATSPGGTNPPAESDDRETERGQVQSTRKSSKP